MAAIGFSLPTIDARSSPIFQISDLRTLTRKHSQLDCIQRQQD